MNITISVSAILAARKLLTRIHFERLKLPVLTHVLATIDAAGLTLAVTDLDHWLETRLPATIDRSQPDVTRFLISATALAVAARGDKGSTVQFECQATPDPEKPVLKVTVTCGKMPVESVYQPCAIEGNYPNCRQVIPREFQADATIPETHRPALISWLRSLDGKGGNGNGKASVRLTWNKPGHLTLTLRDCAAASTELASISK